MVWIKKDGPVLNDRSVMYLDDLLKSEYVADTQ